MCFCKRFISVATLLLIIHITMYILYSRILDTKGSWPYLAIKPSNCLGRETSSKCCIIVSLSSCSVLVQD